MEHIWTRNLKWSCRHMPPKLEEYEIEKCPANRYIWQLQRYRRGGLALVETGK